MFVPVEEISVCGSMERHQLRSHDGRYLYLIVITIIKELVKLPNLNSRWGVRARIRSFGIRDACLM